TRSGASSRNTPTVRASAGSRRAMSRAVWGAIWRRDGAKMKPTASASMATASRASSSLVTPQIFTNTRPIVRRPPPRSPHPFPAAGPDALLLVGTRAILAGGAQGADGGGAVGVGDDRLADEDGVVAGIGQDAGVGGAA